MSVFAELAQADERALLFSPYGLGGMLDRDDALAFQRALIADAVLTDTVPPGLRNSFERLRQKHALGVIDYEQFTEVADAAIGLYEPALRARFAEFYHGQPIPFTDEEGTAQPLISDTYDDIFDWVRKRTLLLPQRDGRRVRFNGMLTDLMRWARDQRLLRGQRARRHEDLIIDIRNVLSHTRPYHIRTPVEATVEFRDLAEFINQLWGVATPGGNRYPAPASREIMAIGWSPTTGARSIGWAESLNPEEDPSWHWVLLRAVPDDRDVERFDSRYATTRWPADYLWGPGPVADAVAWLNSDGPVADEVDMVDRLYLLRQDSNLLYLPQTPEVFAATPPQQRRGRWRLLRADNPNDAFVCVRGLLQPGENHSNCGCPVQRLASGSWSHVRKKLRLLRPALVPHLPADVRVPTPVPWRRAVEIPSS
ncbi:hypothetical protein O7627_33570 [Solwaraspora sp. WMMD1047]|uniref:hypothetical protein n=1 Tax=Solwaraspora sp. WMMD1047 TaxID=3016102 RepID=UPI002417A557|nr:hypothetical protein [Solwaraspora sp. WMMD1047]MDG4834196.1 hypothetical protein [Solwaraspora sp. WMMD1047]